MTKRTVFGSLGLVVIVVDRHRPAHVGDRPPADTAERAPRVPGRDRRGQPHPAAPARRPDEHPRLPDQRQRGPAAGLPAGARGAAGRDARPGRRSSPTIPAQARRAETIRAEALSYVNNYAEQSSRARARTAWLAGRAFASAADGTARAERGRGADRRDSRPPSRIRSARQRGGRRRGVRARVLDRDHRAARVHARPGARDGVRRARGSSGRSGGSRRPRSACARGELDATVPTSGRGRDRPARGDVQRHGALARAVARRAGEPEHRARDAGDRARGAPGGADGVQRRGACAARRAVGDRAAARRGEAAGRGLRGVRGFARDRARRSACWPGSPSRGSSRPPGPTSGVLYAGSWRDDDALAAAGRSRDSTRRALPERIAVGGEGAAARAVATRDVVVLEASQLRVRGLGGEAPLRWELHVPLQIGERSIGVATLGGRELRTRSPRRRARPCCVWPAQAATALAEADALAQQGGSRRSMRRCSTACARASRSSGSTTSWCSRTRRWSGSRGGWRCRSGRRSAPTAARSRRRSTARSTSPTGRPCSRTPTSRPPTSWTVSGLVLERYTAPIEDARGRADRAPGGAARRHPRARVRSAQVDADADRLARAAHAAGVGRGLHGAAAHSAGSTWTRARRSSTRCTARRSGCRR